ncbi:OmpA domain protein [hydrothermal vent metagenome]|uniref:OmpA domain protein n=1 Tax=hydrothermal vent metagenome TaxID=652676 RepID=A0A3B0S4R9_9ZZZZ
MRLSIIFTITATFLAAGALSIVAAGYAVTVIEDNSRKSVRDTLQDNGLTWTEVDADGLQVFLAGTAPSEAKRFKAISLTGTVVDAARVIDQMLVADTVHITPPRFSIEILRHDNGITLIGLIPVATDRDELLADVAKATNGVEVADFLNSADYPQPENWDDALHYAIRSLKMLPRTKISVSADRVEITAMTESLRAKQQVEARLARTAPENVSLSMDISAPRPVITPFSLRFLIENDVARFDACSADTEKARDEILKAAGKAGLQGNADCTIGLGVPSQQWGQAAALAIEALNELGDGSITISDADISLVTAPGVSEEAFDTVIGRLDGALPAVFSLHAVLTPPVDNNTPVIPEFVVTLSPEGLVQIRGRVNSDLTRTTVDSFARARFTSDQVYISTRVTEDLPDSWPLRILTGLEALSYLSNGVVTVTPDRLDITGTTDNKEVGAKVSSFLTEKLEDASQFSINVSYQKALDPMANIPTSDECEAMIAKILAGRKILFEPGSSTIDATAAPIMDDIAEILKQCGEIKMEIGGHTDSQGREVMNQQLSQARAFAVLDELRKRRVLTSGITAIGYGEDKPIADNDTEAGREANRRIEFKLIRPEPVKEQQTGLESLEQPVAEQDAAATKTTDAGTDAAADTATDTGDQNQEEPHDEQN